jgi:hypothetical protein
MFNVCNRTIFLLKFWIFFKLLVLTHTLTSVVDKLLHHINVIKINYANTVTNTVKHTLSIIISLFVFTRLNTKNHHKKRTKMKRNFLVTMFITLPLSSSKDNKQTITCNFFNKLNLVRLFGLIEMFLKNNKFD